MSNKLTLPEWIKKYTKEVGITGSQAEAIHMTWDFCKAQEQKEIEELRQEVAMLKEENLKLNEYKFMYEGLCK